MAIHIPLLLLLGIMMTHASYTIVQPIHNATYGIFNLTAVISQVNHTDSQLTVQWTSPTLVHPINLTFPVIAAPANLSMVYSFALAPLAFGPFTQNTVSFLPSGTYTWLNVTFHVVTQCTDPGQNLSTQCQTCNHGYADLAPPCTVCDDEFFGPYCNQSALECAQTRCSQGMGTCVGRFEGCSCDTDRFMANCSLNHSQCATQFCHGVGVCDTSVRNTDAVVCICPSPNHNTTSNCGRCLYQYDPATNCSSCRPGWYDQDCDFWAPLCALYRCSGQGTCSGQLSGCTCLFAYTGPDCSESACTGPGGGQPADNGTRCSCTFPNHIDPQDAHRCVLVCHPTQGKWIDGTCHCLPGFTGTRCTEPSDDWLSTWWGIPVLLLGIAVIIAVGVWCGLEAHRYLHTHHYQYEAVAVTEDDGTDATHRPPDARPPAQPAAPGRRRTTAPLVDRAAAKRGVLDNL